MAALYRLIWYLLPFSFISSLCFFGYCKVIVKRLENCDDNESYKVRFKFTFKTVGDKQVANATLVYTAPVDNKLRANVSVEMFVGNQYVYMFAINEKKSCDALNKYFGEMWYDIERHAGMLPGLCPISKGTYHLHNFLIDWGKMATLQSFPFGKMRFIFMVYDTQNTVFTCFVLDVLHQI